MTAAPRRALVLLALAALLVGLVPPAHGATRQAATPERPGSQRLESERPESDRPDLQALLDAVVASGVPGVAAYVRDEAGTWQGAAGVADPRTARPMRPDLRVRVGSLTKPFVAVAVLQLVDEERLALDDPVAAHLPGVLPDGADVTLRQLLQHTSGIPDYVPAVLPDFWVEPGTQRRFRPPETLVAAVADAPRLFPPGAGWSYSNTNYVLLGMVVEAVTGDRVDQVLRERVIRPAGLTDTWLPVHSLNLGGAAASGISQPYDRDLQPIGEPVEIAHYTPSVAGAAGALVSTPADLARFEAALLDGTLLPADLLAEMRNTVETGLPGERYGLGLVELDLPCGPVVGHTGGIFGYTTYAFSSPDGARQVALVATSDAITLDQLLAINVAAVALSCPGWTPPAPPGAAAAARAPSLLPLRR